MPDVYSRPRSAALEPHSVQAYPTRAFRDALLRARPNGATGWGIHDVRAYAARYFDLITVVVGGFPVQFDGLRTFYNAAMRELCLVAVADAPVGMGGQIFIDKNGTVYSVYLVETGDANASHVRIQTSTGIKAIRLKT